MKVKRVDHVDLVVRDIARAVEFYKKLGLVVQGTLDGGRTVFLWNQDRQRPLVFELHQAEPGQAPGLGHIALHVDDVEEAHSQLQGAGVSFSITPRHVSLSGRAIAETEDPDGIHIQLARKTGRGDYEDFR